MPADPLPVGVALCVVGVLLLAFHKTLVEGNRALRGGAEAQRTDRASTVWYTTGGALLLALGLMLVYAGLRIGQ